MIITYFKRFYLNDQKANEVHKGKNDSATSHIVDEKRREQKSIFNKDNKKKKLCDFQNCKGMSFAKDKGKIEKDTSDSNKFQI